MQRHTTMVLSYDLFAHSITSRMTVNQMLSVYSDLCGFLFALSLSTFLFDFVLMAVTWFCSAIGTSCHFVWSASWFWTLSWLYIQSQLFSGLFGCHDCKGSHYSSCSGLLCWELVTMVLAAVSPNIWKMCLLTPLLSCHGY
jgi:hypothetical protein